MPNCWRTPIPKFQFFMLLLSLVAGPQKIWNVTLKWANKKKNIVKGYTWNKICFFCLFKSKNWRERGKHICVTIFYIKNRFGHFWDLQKNIKQLLISNFIIGNCSLMYNANFHTKIFIINAPAIFWKWKLCRACVAYGAAKFAEFFLLTS